MNKENNPVIIIELDRARELRFGHKAMKRWSAHTGKPITQLDTDNMGPEEVEVLLYYMLEQDAKTHGEALSLGQMEDLLDLAPLGVVYAKLAEAMEAAFPRSDLTGKNGGRAEAGTGMNA